MTWTVWGLGAVLAFLPGAFLVRAGRLKTVRFYLAGCTLLTIAWVFGLGAAIGPAFAPWPKYLLAMLAPGTLLLAMWGVRRDRERVMGTAQDRDAIATAAILYGASQTHDSGAGGDVGDAGGGGF